jgi:hypothetical protein
MWQQQGRQQPTQDTASVLRWQRSCASWRGRRPAELHRYSMQPAAVWHWLAAVRGPLVMSGPCCQPTLLSLSTAAFICGTLGPAQFCVETMPHLFQCAPPALVHSACCSGRKLSVP